MTYCRKKFINEDIPINFKRRAPLSCGDIKSYVSLSMTNPKARQLLKEQTKKGKKRKSK